MSPTDRYSKARNRGKEIKCRWCGERFFNYHALSLHIKYHCPIMSNRMKKLRNEP